MPQDQVSNPSEVLDIPLADLYIPDWNPRKHIDQAEMDDLVAHLENGGFVPRILLWKGPSNSTDSSIARESAHPNREPRLGASAQGPYAVISGQRRMLAFERLERTHIPAEILDVSLAEARRMARDTNIDAKPHWLDDGINLESLLADNLISQRELAKKEKSTKSSLNRTVLLMKVLNPQARALIRQSLTASKPTTSALDPESVPRWDTGIENKGNSEVLLEKVAFQLTGFLPNRRLEEAQAMALEALKVIIDRQLSSSQAAALVQWKLSGKPISEFDPALRPAKATNSKVAPASEAHVPVPKAPKVDTPLSEQSTSTPAASTQPSVHTRSAKPESPAGTSSAKATMGSAETVADSRPHASSAVASSAKPESASSNPAPRLGNSEQILFEALAGMSLVARIKAKIKKGERPSLFEGLVLVADLLWRGFAWVAKHSWKVAKWLLKETWKSSKATLRMLGAKVLRIVGGVLGLLFLCLVLWFGWDAYEHGILHPFQEIGTVWTLTHVSKSETPSNFHKHPETPAQVPVQAATPVQNVLQPAPTIEPTAKVVAREKAPAHTDSLSSGESVQPNHVAQLVASQQVPEKVANVSVTPTVLAKKADSLDDLANTVAKQAGPGAVADAAKKIFGL